MPTYKTTWEDDNGSEYAIEIEYDYQPSEPATLEYPGCDEEVTITDVKRWGIAKVDKAGYIHKGWVDFWDESLKDHAKWSEEILESINNERE